MLLLSLLVALAFLQPPPAAPPVLARTIPLEGVRGRIDHLAYDPATSRLFIAALENGSLEAVDLDKGQRAGSVRDLNEPQGVLCLAPAKQVLVTCGGAGMLRAFDAATLEPRQSVPIGDDPDNLRLTADGKSIVVGYGGGALALLDAATLKKTAEVA